MTSPAGFLTSRGGQCVFSAVEAGEEVAVTRHGKVVARLVPDSPRTAAEAFRDFCEDSDVDLQAPPDTPAEEVHSLD